MVRARAGDRPTQPRRVVVAVAPTLTVGLTITPVVVALGAGTLSFRICRATSRLHRSLAVLLLERVGVNRGELRRSWLALMKCDSSTGQVLTQMWPGIILLEFEEFLGMRMVGVIGDHRYRARFGRRSTTMCDGELTLIMVSNHHRAFKARFMVWDRVVCMTINPMGDKWERTVAARRDFPMVIAVVMAASQMEVFLEGPPMGTEVLRTEDHRGMASPMEGHRVEATRAEVRVADRPAGVLQVGIQEEDRLEEVILVVGPLVEDIREETLRGDLDLGVCQGPEAQTGSQEEVLVVQGDQEAPVGLAAQAGKVTLMPGTPRIRTIRAEMTWFVACKCSSACKQPKFKPWGAIRSFARMFALR